MKQFCSEFANVAFYIVTAFYLRDIVA